MKNASEDRMLYIQLLGDFRLVYGDEPVASIDTPRLQALLAYLLLHRDAPQSRHRLAFLFWPDSPEAQALTNLRNLLYRLRHDLPDADRFLDVGHNTLQWRPESPFDFDVARFEEALDRADKALDDLDGGSPDRGQAREALERAVAVYEGDLLPSCYEDWIVSERQRLSQTFQRALERLTRLLEDQQEYGAAIRFAQQLLRHDPVREASYRRLMRLHALIGDRAGALRIYHQCATVLERELDVEPSPVTREIYEQLLAVEETPRLPPRPPGRMAAASPLVGRHKVWAQLRGAWRVAAAGRPRFALISGEAGVGKTRLAEELIQWAARQGIATASARCYASEGDLAYAPVAAWLRALPLMRLDRVWLSEIARVLPELLSEQPHLSPPGPLIEPWQRRRFFEALARGVLASDQPLLLFIDSLQWCDRGTFEWLHYLLRYDPRARLLVVGTLRPGEAEDEDLLAALLRALRHNEQLTEVTLSPLSKAETGTLAANVASRDLHQNLIDCLYAETEGNPLFVVETARAGLPDEVRGSPSEGFVCIPRPLPSRMRDALVARVDQLSPLARGLAELAATIGREFTFDVLARASEADEDRLVRGLDELWQRRIVREQGQDAYDFSHDKLREIAYDGLSEARRRMLHRHVASALEAVHADDLDAVAARVAAHYEHAGELEEAAAYYARAAPVAERMQQREDAARYRQRASALLEKSTTGKS
jgi:DNA-binding SARP family transcriptional activator